MRDWVTVGLVGLVGCGWLPPDKTTPAASPAAPAPADPDAAALVHTWLVEEHVMVKGASIEEADAISFHGRTVVVGEAGFVSPWQGTCEDAAREKTARKRGGIISELAVESTDRARLGTYGLGEDVTEFRLTCKDRSKPPPLILYVSSGKAMTCFGGACYLMKPF